MFLGFLLVVAHGSRNSNRSLKAGKSGDYQGKMLLLAISRAILSAG
ncbi:hypothetical protein THTE_2533 [Thermogutta terrifontis]|uniref:Uncharacterized protein n=1 Tax=Thermogutta terrifontis TaxID=1331910 RepID=A0A286RGN5_9BACT|nr:hypothetical protein THTE_2533 [Thermogutta terrifontis]